MKKKYDISSLRLILPKPMAKEVVWQFTNLTANDSSHNEFCYDNLSCDEFVRPVRHYVYLHVFYG